MNRDAGPQAHPTPAAVAGRRALTALRLVVGIILLWFVLSRAGGWPVLGELFTRGWIIPAFVGVALAGLVIEAKRLGLMLKSQRLALPMTNAYRLLTVGMFFGFVIPGGTGGDLMKLYYLASENRSLGVEVAAVLLVDRVVGLASLLVVIVGLALVGGVLPPGGGPVAGLVGAAALALVVMLGVAGLSWSPRVRQGKLYRYVTTRGPLHRPLDRLFNAFLAFRNHKPAILEALALSVLGQLLLGAVFALAGGALFPEAPPLRVAALCLLGLIANVLPVTPGGLGVGEAAVTGLFGLAGLIGGAQLVVAWRLGLLPLALTGGVVHLFGMRRPGRRITRRDEAPHRGDSAPPGAAPSLASTRDP